MNNSKYRNTLIAAGIAATLGLGAIGCGQRTDQSSTQAGTQAGATQDVSDSAITSGVKAKLATDSNLAASDITVTTENGTVTLTGTVSDTAARSAAESATRSYAGVSNVNNRLSVQGATGDATRTAGDTARATGDAASRTASDAAQATGDAAERAGQAVSDTWITTKVKSVLLADSDASGLDISVETNDGVVTLEGELTSQADLDHVTALVMDVEGVKRVRTNALTIASR